MNKADRDNANLHIILATSNNEEQAEMIKVLGDENSAHRIFTPATLKEFDQVTQENNIDLVITDFEYQNGSLVDWLTLWPYPYILLASPGSCDKLDAVMNDETSSFLIRRDDLLHVRFVPKMVKKVINVKTSREVQNSYIKVSEKQYMNLVQALPDIIYVLDSDGNFTFINNAVRSLGWEPVELIGKHFSILLYQDDIQRVSRDHILPTLRGRVTGDDRAPKLFDERRTGHRMTRGLQMKMKRKPTVGGNIDVSLTAYGEVSAIGYTGFQIHGIDGLGTAGIIRENRQILSPEEYENVAKSIFKSDGVMSHDQVMHLINNKLQILSSLISLKLNSCTDPTAAGSLSEVQSQLYTFSLVYQNMVTVGNQVLIKMETYLDDVIKHLISSYAGNPWVQEIDLHCDPINLEEDSAITVSLFINEFISVFLKIQDNLNKGSFPLTITFLKNHDMAQLKLRTSERVFRGYTELIEKDGSEVVTETLVDILQGRIFYDNESLTLFFNLE